MQKAQWSLQAIVVSVLLWLPTGCLSGAAFQHTGASYSGTNMTKLLHATRHSAGGLSREFQDLDTNFDGRLSHDELQQSGLAEYLNKRLDDHKCPECPMDQAGYDEMHFKAKLWQRTVNDLTPDTVWNKQIIATERNRSGGRSESVCYPPKSESAAQTSLWEGSPVPETMYDRCDVPILDSTVSPQEFIQEFVFAHRPALIRNVSTSWLAASLWNNRTALEQMYGERLFFVGRIPPEMASVRSLTSFLNYTTSPEALQITSGECSQGNELCSPPLYMWQDAVKDPTNNTGSQRHMLEDTSIPPMIAHLGDVSTRNSCDCRPEVMAASVTMGAACSGSSFHQHDNAFNVLVHGLKYWLLIEQEESELLDYHWMRVSPHAMGLVQSFRSKRGAEWWKTRTRHQLECVQRAGDLFYVPSNYIHAVLNLWPSVGINQEFAILYGAEELDRSYHESQQSPEENDNFEGGEMEVEANQHALRDIMEKMYQADKGQREL